MPRPQISTDKTTEKDIVQWCAKNLELTVAPQSRYSPQKHVLLVLLAAVRGIFLETAQRASSKCGARQVLSPRDLLYRLKTWVLSGMLEGALLTLNERILREARRRRRLPCTAVASIDYTDTPYYGKGSRRVCCRGREKRGTNWFFKTAALHLVVRDERYTVAWVKVLPLVRHETVVAQLLDAAERWVHVRLVLMDREFYTDAILKALRERGIRALVAVPKHSREKRAVERCKGLKWHSEPWTKGGYKDWTMIVVDNVWLREQLKDRRESKGHSLWMTDLPVHNDPLPYVRTYNRRWSIENSFQEEDRFQARTKSPDAGLRFSLLLFSLVLRNLWVLLRRIDDELTTFVLREVLCMRSCQLLGVFRRINVVLALEEAGG